MPNNNSGTDLDRLSDGTLVIAYNPVANDWGPRTPLRLALSRDNGATWPEYVDLETKEGEFSYPALVTFGEEILVTYVDAQ